MKDQRITQNIKIWTSPIEKNTNGEFWQDLLIYEILQQLLTVYRAYLMEKKLEKKWWSLLTLIISGEEIGAEMCWPWLYALQKVNR